MRLSRLSKNIQDSISEVKKSEEFSAVLTLPHNGRDLDFDCDYLEIQNQKITYFKDGIVVKEISTEEF